MKRLIFLILVLAGVAYYVNQAALVPGWAPYPLPDWVPGWARFAPPAGQPDQAARGRRGGGGRGGRAARGAQEEPVPVVVAASRYEDVPVNVDAVGTVQALNTVTVRTQVDGKLIEIDFKDGQDVKKGDVLARIDPSLYQAQYDQAVATKAKDEALLANARNDLLRYQKLAQTEAGSKQQADTQKSLVAQLEAQVRVDQGAIDNAKTMLAYTTITAPIDGRTGIRFVDQGNILHASDATGIVVITQLKPINAVFSLPQQQLRAVNGAMAKGPVPVRALAADNITVLDQGTIQVVDNQVDPATGTVKIKAVFPNAQTELWPGQFVNVRVTLEVLKHAVVIPTAALQRGPDGAFVYVVDGDKAVLRTVKPGRQDENQAVIDSGLTPPEKVVTTGFARLTDGAKVAVEAPGARSEGPPPPSGERPRHAAGFGGPQAAPSPGAPAPDASQRDGGERRRHRRGGADTPAAPSGGAPPRQ
jgi:multidrug efflux system membrane fusion protein